MTKTNTNAGQATLPGHVLVVEDDTVQGLVIEQALTDAGVALIEIATTTDQALQALRRKCPDAVVLDVHLADRDDGWAIAELIHGLGPNGPQIIFSTGMPGEIPPHIAANARILAKPYDASALVDLLRQTRRRGVMSLLRGALR